MMRNSGKLKILVVTLCAVVLLDQITKCWVHETFQWGESRVVLPAFFSLTYVRNKGAAFGIFHQAPAWFREPFFMVMPFLVLSIILFLFFKLHAKQRWTSLALSLIVGGAVGNLIDRFRFGYVIDFLDFHWKEIYHWPAFNIADTAIVVGVGVVFLVTLWEEQKALKKRK